MKHEDFSHHLTATKEFLSQQLSTLRTGRASTALVEDIPVEAYGGAAPMPIKELGSVAISDGQSILITPWDKGVLKKIEDAIRSSNKGLNPVNEGDAIRVPVPQLTEDRRKEYAKDVWKYVEEAKIRIRNIRQDVMKSFEEQEDNGLITEDDLHREKKMVEEQVSKINLELETMGKHKETEIMQV